MGHESYDCTAILPGVPDLVIQSPRRIDVSVYPQRLFLWLPSPTEQEIFDFVNRKFKSGATVIADLTSGAWSLDYWFLVYVNIKYVNWTRSHAGATHHTVISADHFVE
jgi:hypothetical protein